MKLKIPILTYTAPEKENTRQKYDRKRTAFTKAVFSDRLRQTYTIVLHLIASYTPAVYDHRIGSSYCDVCHRIRSLLIDLGSLIFIDTL